MSTATVCGICGTALADRTCPNCGTAVCDDDFDAEHGLCVACLDEATGAGDLGPGDLPR
ncbi:MAG: hypothetical protein V5A31_08030 [Haloferacaceae archaeon]|jgi:hypothetical protein